ncbi:hypothetical protein BJ875DRAFT_86503 [Amylocarpus encephaloides]|uniref:RRM domain-containing protein n=1 Tax=Amylocarpus encephaloides TaxID=45428 RepID=A0A9P8CAM2_9HELO|nr:hypothetical protein BJ875DRAFT_86503 [Amylocarpus encephaloides]
MADPIGEDSWLALVDEASRTARDIGERVGVVELYKRSLHAEPWSNKLWLAYCEWYWSLYTDSQNSDAGWPEEEQMLGQELFSLEAALGEWQKGGSATKYRLDDSHELWNRWISIELEQLSKSQNRADVERIKHLFLERLQIPHATWDETSSMFSSFLTNYDQAAYEETFLEATRSAAAAKTLYANRETFEWTLEKRRENTAEYLLAWKDYIDWEIAQSIKRPKQGQAKSPLYLCTALFERALCSTPLGLDPEIWEDYITYVSSTKEDIPETPIDILSVCQRATSHCPFSGTLWARFIVCAEAKGLPFSYIEQIKHAATGTGDIDRDGMGGVVELYAAWSSYLKRRAVAPDATQEDKDVADMGLPTALESVEEWGQRRQGKSGWSGDPMFRVERIFIEYLTQKANGFKQEMDRENRDDLFREARGYWQKLVKKHGNGYEFWQQYYLWEMTVRPLNLPPTRATDVLKEAVHRSYNMDWPEKMMEIYLRHCSNHEGVHALLTAKNTVRRNTKTVIKRRQKEAAEAAALYAQAQPEVAVELEVQESPSGASKRKREDIPEDTDEASAKRAKQEPTAGDHQEQHLKRDRENTTILVTNLPPGVTQTKVKRYFKDHGLSHIQNTTLKTELDEQSSTALIEFQSTDDLKSSLLRDQKYFGDRQIRVEPATGLTLYVTNFPPESDESFLTRLFKGCGQIFDIRWPSLKKNTLRRFCYVSFRNQEAAAAATKLDGTLVSGEDGPYKLLAKYSDPTNKKGREGAMAEDRELHITGIDFALTQDDLKEVFGKYGTVERVNLLTSGLGKSTGAAFISFARKEEAAAALDLDKTKLRSRILNVEMSQGKNFKRMATMKGSSMSPAPDFEGHSVVSASPAPDRHPNTHARHAPNHSDVTNREIVLLNIPDTINDARINVIAKPYGEIVKLVLRPDHQGAIIEYADVAAAGRAALGLENYEIVPGRYLQTGSRKDLFSRKEEMKTKNTLATKESKKASPALMQSSAPIRRPGAGGRGGLGVKRGLGYAAPKKLLGNADENGSASKEESKPTKSNADFRALVNGK